MAKGFFVQPLKTGTVTWEQSVAMCFPLNKRPVGLTRIASLKRKHVIQQIRLHNSGPTREDFKYCMEATERRDVSSRFSWKEKNSFFESRCKTLLFNFENCLTLKGPSISDFGTATRGGESAFICNLCYLKTNNNGICCYHTTSEILSATIKTLELFLAMIRQKMLENSKFIVFPVIRLKFGAGVNLRG